MKIACISPWYSEGMGYTENLFPKAFAKLGADTHLVTSNAQINYYHPKYDEVYKPFLGPKFVDCGIKKISGYTVHRLPYYETKKIFTGPGIRNLYEYLTTLKPDIIQTFEIGVATTFPAAKYAHENEGRFFTECHVHASVFRKFPSQTWKEPIKNLVNAFDRELNYINRATSVCYAIAEDAAEIAMSYYRVPRHKIKVQSLGVDTDTFFPLQQPKLSKVKNSIREKMGLQETDIVCIYTGRFTKDKNPHCLAQAIDQLNREGMPFRGLFVGSGTEEDIQFLKSMKGCVVGSFVPSIELPNYYWASDIGVWPREESTSQLDALACGLPLVLSNRIKVLERIEGTGFVYNEGDHLDLASTLRKMTDPVTRKEMSELGIKRIYEKFSWEIIARQRMIDYESFLNHKLDK